MHIHIDTADKAERERVKRLLQYLLSGQQAKIDSLLLSIEPVCDALGTRLNRCQLRSTLKHGQQIEVEGYSRVSTWPSSVLWNAACE